MLNKKYCTTVRLYAQWAAAASASGALLQCYVLQVAQSYALGFGDDGGTVARRASDTQPVLKYNKQSNHCTTSKYF